MSIKRTAEELWKTAPVASEVFGPSLVEHLPRPAQRYFVHALQVGAKLAQAARLRMHGSIRLKGEWYPFEAEQVLRWDRGFLWRATVRTKGVSIRGFDQWLDGEAALRWKLLGVVPVVTAQGSEVARSAAGRLHGEALWLPPALLGSEVEWVELESGHPQAIVTAHGESTRLDLALDAAGALRSFHFPRWGNPEGAHFHYADFGGFIEDERTFDGLTVPTELRIGWFFGTDRFESDGEFFRVTIDDVEYR